MKRRIVALLILATGAVGACATRAERVPEATPERSRCCGSPEADLHGCISPECCAKTGRPCGQATCTCSPLIVETPEVGALK